MSFSWSPAFILLLFGLFSPPVSAQSQVETTQNTFAQAYAEVRSGPGAFYTSRGRIYRGDPLVVIERDTKAGWVKIRTGGLVGWLPMGARMATASEGAERDPGRDRKTTNYGYDAKGRRLDGAGAMAGSGETHPINASSTPSGATPVTGQSASASTSLFNFRFGFGLALTDRVFASNIATSPLSAVQASPKLAGIELGVDWRKNIELGPISTRLGLALLVQDRRFGSISVPVPVGDTTEATSIKVEGQRVDATVRWLYVLGQFGLGPYVGLQLFRSAYQESENLVFFLTTQILAAATGVELSWTLDRIELRAKGAVLMPLAVTQKPYDSGEPTGSGYQFGLEGRLRIKALFSVYLCAALNRYALDFNGLATHTDQILNEDYDLAQEVNRFVDLTAGLQLTF